MTWRASVPRREQQRVTLVLKILFERPKSWAVSRPGEGQDMFFLPKRCVIRDEAGDSARGAAFHVPLWLAREKGLSS